MSRYAVKEIYLTLQGEGAQSGRVAVFLRFAGCNLWSGREEDRATAICQFCDTDFFGTDGEKGGKYDLETLIQVVSDLHPETTGKKYIVLTGGEPALQLDDKLLTALHQNDFEVAIETNGTKPLPHGVDWVCVSPKANTDIVLTHGDELKLVYPQLGAEPDLYESLDFDHFYLQPMDGPYQERNTKLAAKYCLEHPKWKLSIQSHKYLGID